MGKRRRRANEVEAAETAENTSWVLSLDGGGIRGLITARWLEAIEEELGKKTGEIFDLVAGTSTGSILACAVSMGIPASEIVSMYLERSSEIFSGSGFLAGVGRLFREGASRPKYSAQGLEGELKRVFEDRKFGDIDLARVIVTTYNTESRQPMIFKSWREEYQQYPTWEIVKASCSAPTYFPGHGFQTGRYQIPLIDGGVVANNPSACALAEVIRLRSEAKQSTDLAHLRLLSLGTGQLTKPISLGDTQEWGALEWAIPIIDVLFDGASDAVDYQCRQILDDKYARVQCDLRTGVDEMDNAEPANLRALLRVADATLRNGALSRMVSFLS